MPYRNIENMSRRGEKIAPFLTVENVVGLIITGVIGYGLSAALPGGWRMVFIGACLALGYVATLEAKGMARYQRLLWMLRGLLASIQRPTIIPDDLPGSALHSHVPIMRQDGIVRLRTTQTPSATVQQVRSAQAAVAHTLRTTRRKPVGGND
jgi:hypothetical protein